MKEELIKWIDDKIQMYKKTSYMSDYKTQLTGKDIDDYIILELLRVKAQIEELAEQNKCSCDIKSRRLDGKCIIHNKRISEEQDTIECPTCYGKSFYTRYIDYKFIEKETVSCRNCEGTGRIPKPKEVE